MTCRRVSLPSERADRASGALATLGNVPASFLACLPPALPELDFAGSRRGAPEQAVGHWPRSVCDHDVFKDEGAENNLLIPWAAGTSERGAA